MPKPTTRERRVHLEFGKKTRGVKSVARNMGKVVWCRRGELPSHVCNRGSRVGEMGTRKEIEGGRRAEGGREATRFNTRR